MSRADKLILIEQSIEAENRERAQLAKLINMLSLKLAYLKSRGITGPRNLS